VPNAFLSDPELAQVVSRSLELGARGHHRLAPSARVRWVLAGFETRNADDILFVAGNRVGTGFFRNAGTTQRAGGEASIEAQLGAVRAFVAYTWLRATFEDPLTLSGPNHPRARTTASGSRVIDVVPGDRIPGLPEHALKLGVSVEPIPQLTLGPF